MKTYGETALKAVEIWNQNKPAGPSSAWLEAARACFPTSKSLQEKSCPKSAFLGLCEEGLVKDIPKGKYTRSKLNKAYALRAVSLLKQQSDLANHPNRLWQLVINGATTVPNGQMEVVTAL